MCVEDVNSFCLFQALTSCIHVSCVVREMKSTKSVHGVDDRPISGIVISKSMYVGLYSSSLSSTSIGSLNSLQPRDIFTALDHF